MPITELRIAGYRSFRQLEIPLTPVTVVTGANGCGKSSLYRALRLLQFAADGRFAHAIVEEGGLGSALWAGERAKGAVRMSIGTNVDNFRYDLSVGLPAKDDLPSPFTTDPVFKEESIRFGETKAASILMERSNQSVWARDGAGNKQNYPLSLGRSESALFGLREPHLFPHLNGLRQTFLNWRFYHHFRTDSDAPIRNSQTGLFTPVLANDGRDLAAALTTIQVIGFAEELDEAVDRAFPGGTLELNAGGGFSVALKLPGVHRPMTSAEMSDGTLRYLCLLAALLSPRPPKMLALNEPETSLHPDLLPPLAALISRVAMDSQVWVTTHSPLLADSIAAQSGHAPLRLVLNNGETKLLKN